MKRILTSKEKIKLKEIMDKLRNPKEVKARARIDKEIKESLTNRNKYLWPRLGSDYKWSEKRQTYIYSFRKPSTWVQCLLASKK